MPGFIWRGQADADWPLESSLDRVLRISGKPNVSIVRERHLRDFKLAVRGRRGPSPSRLETENDWWALRQHYGLATPLLDWTHSPYVALYFALIEESTATNRAVYAINTRHVQNIGELRKFKKLPDHPIAPIEFIQPFLDENARLVNQGGLFTRAPDGYTINRWVEEVGDPEIGLLTQIVIPSSGREDALRSLDRMNINHLSLFPDLNGASIHCNNLLRGLEAQ